MSEDTTEIQTLDCVICYNEIDVNDRKGYMLAPCDHIFHRHCLEQWMDVKVSHYLLLHEVGLPHPCAKCSFLFFPRWNVQYVGVICLPFKDTYAAPLPALTNYLHWPAAMHVPVPTHSRLTQTAERAERLAGH